MTPIRNILLATDFSESAEAATELAIEMARRLAAGLTILHVYGPHHYIGAYGDVYLWPKDMVDKIRLDAESAIEELRQRIEKSGVAVESVVVEGIAADLIVGVARSRHMDLIVMGTKGRSGFKHLLLGSVAERVVRTAGCPVLTVRTPADMFTARAGSQN